MSDQYTLIYDFDIFDGGCCDIDAKELTTLEGIKCGIYKDISHLRIIGKNLISLEGAPKSSFVLHIDTPNLRRINNDDLSSITRIDIYSDNKDFSFLREFKKLKDIRISKDKVYLALDHLSKIRLREIIIKGERYECWNAYYYKLKYTKMILKRLFVRDRISMIWFSFFEGKRDKFNYNRLSYFCN